jgi:FkbM family methyltransferase
MDSILRERYHLLSEIAKSPLLGEFPFTLFDIGCSGGIHSAWDKLGDHLIARAYDLNRAECQRLAASERRPGVRYEGLPVGLPKHHPFWAGVPDGPESDFFTRTSAAHALRIATPADVRRNDFGQLDDSKPLEPTAVDDLVAQEQVPYVDVLKVDVDGTDLAVLHSAAETLKSRRTCCVLAEVCFEGTADVHSNTFSNIDMFLRRQGFYLGALSIWRYSLADLPSPFKFRAIGETVFGAPFLGDAAYFRPPEWTGGATASLRQHVASVIKLAALCEMFYVPDHAVRLLLSNRRCLEECGVDCRAMIDLVTEGVRPGMTHEEYLKMFREDINAFFPQ